MKYLDKIKKIDIEKDFPKLLKKINKNDITIFITVLISGLINYFYFLNNIVLSPDGLVYGPTHISSGWEFMLGRPLLMVVDRLRGGLVIPHIIVLVSLIYISIGIMLIRRIFNIDKKIYLIILSILTTLFPVFSETSLFIYCFDSYSLAFLFSILGLYFIKNRKYIFSIISIIISLSLYQAYISITITGVLLLFIIDLLDNKKCNIKTPIIQMLTILSGIISYFILLKCSLLILGKQMADYKGASSFGIETFKLLPESIIHAYQDFFSFFFKENIIYNSYYYRQFLYLIIIIILFYIILKRFTKLEKTNKLLLILSIIILPITINIMNLIACQTTINLVTAIGFIMFFILTIICINKYLDNKLIKNIEIILLIIISYTYLLSNNATFMARVDTFNNYYAKSTIILNKIKNLEGYNENLKLMFSENITYTSNMLPYSNGYLAKDSETFPNYLGILENENFYKRFFGINITIVNEEEYNKIINSDEYKNMTTDIAIINDVIVIKVN